MNDRIAAELRGKFEAHGIFCVNLISSPGSGKTSLLERTLESFPKHERVAVLTGDIQTENDAIRLARFHFPVKQIMNVTASSRGITLRVTGMSFLDSSAIFFSMASISSGVNGRLYEKS